MSPKKGKKGEKVLSVTETNDGVKVILQFDDGSTAVRVFPGEVPDKYLRYLPPDPSE